MEGKECFFYINPSTFRKAKIVYNFGLSECNRVSECNRIKRKTIVLSKDVKIIFLCNVFLSFHSQK